MDKMTVKELLELRTSTETKISLAISDAIEGFEQKSGINVSHVSIDVTPGYYGFADSMVVRVYTEFEKVLKDESVS